MSDPIVLAPRVSLVEPSHAVAMAQMAMTAVREGGEHLARRAEAVRALSSVPQPARSLAEDRGVDLAEGPGYTLLGSVAIVPVCGYIAYAPSVWSWLFGSTTATDIVRAVDAAARDRRVEAIALHFDSPGGEVLAIDDVLEAMDRCLKPTHGFISTAYSLACWISAACGSLSAAPAACGGSVGATSWPIVDESARLAAEGVVVHAVSSHAGKDTGNSIVAQTPEMVESVRDELRVLGARFVADLATRRGLDPSVVDGWAGRSFAGGNELVARGLADRVETARSFFARLIDAYPGAAAASVSVPAAQTATTQTQAGAAHRAATEDPSMTIQEIIEKYGLPEDAAEDLQTLIDNAGDGEVEIEVEEPESAENMPEEDLSATVDEITEMAPAVANRDSLVLECLRRKMTKAEASAFFLGVRSFGGSTIADDEAPTGTAPVRTGDKADTATAATNAKAEADRLTRELMASTGKPRHECWDRVMSKHPELADALR